MGLAVWPTGVPFIPVRESYGVKGNDTKLDVTEMESGPDRQRATESADWSMHDYAIVMTVAEWNVLKPFLQKTLVKASARFNIPVVRFDDEVNPSALRQVYIPGGAYDVKPYAIDYVIVSFKLRMLDW